MRRRKLIVVLVVVVFGAFVLLPGPGRITPVNYARIQPGMSRAEVEAILGPPGDYRTRDSEQDTDLDLSDMAIVGSIDLHQAYIWASDQAVVLAAFDETEKFVGGGCVKPSGIVHKGPLDNLLWRAKRLWQRWFP